MMQNPQYAADFEALLAVCQARDVAVQTIKAVARRPWHTEERAYAPWYEPLEDQASIDRAVHWVLSRPGIFLNTVGDVQLLPKALDAASRFQHAPSAAQMQADMANLHMEPLFV
jgi:hypothetical protein